MIQTSSAGRQRGRIFMFAIIGVAAIAAGVIVSMKLMERTQELQAAQVYPSARLVADFDLRTTDGERFSRDNLLGRWTLVFFGFTNCPDICPDTLAVLAQSLRELEIMRREELPQVVFVSVDPDRDQMDLLGEYVSWFRDDFVGVTGSDQQLQALARQLGIVYFHEAADADTGFYNVDHSASVLIIDPEGRLYGRFAPPLEPSAVTADLFAISR